MKKTVALFFISLLTFLFIYNSNAQDDKERIGAEEILKAGINYYNYADKDKVNIEVLVWGGIKNPGKYLIPYGTTVIDLITLAGGPESERSIEYVKLYRIKSDSLKMKTTEVINLDYSDFFEKEAKKINKLNPVLTAGDMITIPIEEEKTFWDYFDKVFLYTTSVISLILLIVNLYKE